MEITTKILFVEHDRNDLELLQYTLRREGLQFIAEVATNEQEFIAALKNFTPDIILADYAFPSFNGRLAFEQSVKHFPDVPFLLVTGTIGEEKSVELMKDGITDFVFKDKLFTLFPKVTRALKEADDQRIKRNTEVELQKSERRYRHIVENAHEGIWLTDSNGLTILVNNAVSVFLGYAPAEMIGKPKVFFIAERFQMSFVEWLNEKDDSRQHSIEIQFTTKEGLGVWALVSANPVVIDSGGGIGRLTMLTDITEQKKNEALVKSSEERYRVLFEQNLAGIYITSLNGEILNCNDMFVKMLKYASVDEIVGRNVFDFYCDPYQREKVALSFANHENISNGELELCCKDNSRIYVLKNVSIRAEAMDNSFFCDGIVVDITERKRAEEQMGWLINNTEESFILLDRKLNIISFNDQADKSVNNLLGQKLVVGSDIIDYALSTDHSALLEIYRKVLDGEEESREICFPVEGKPDKVFILKYKPAYDDHNDVIGVFVSIVDISERRMAQEEKEFEARDKEALINNTTDLIWSITKDFKLSAANQAFIDSVRNNINIDLKRGDEMMFEGKFPAEFLVLWEKLYVRALKGESFIEEIHTPQWGDFSETWAETRFNPIFDGDEITGVACYTRDTTASKYYSTNLLEMNKKLMTAQQISQLGYWEWNIENDTLFWSHEVYKIWEESISTYVVNNENFFNSIHPDDRKIFDQAREIAMTGQAKLNVEHRIVCKNGKVKFVQERGELVYNARGIPIKFEGTVQDITARKKIDAEIKELAYRLSLATTSAGLGIWDWNIINNTLTWDQEMFRLFVRNKDQFEVTYQSFLNLLHPEDRDNVESKLLEAIDENREFNSEFRFITPDQSIRYIKATGMIERDKQGKAVRMIGTNRDITLQREREQQLKLLESVVTNTTDAVLITDAGDAYRMNPKVVYVNHAFTQMTGYSVDEVQGQSPAILQGPKSDKAELEKLNLAMSKWQSCEVTTINYKKNGDEFWINFSISPVADASGRYTHWIAIERDITERKLSEIRLNELNLNLQIQSNELAISNAALEQFAYVASHDLQEPLRMVTSFLKMLKSRYVDIIDSRGNTYIDFAMDGAVRMRQIILDLLEFSRIGINDSDAEEVDLNDVMKEIRQLYKMEISESGAVLIVDELPLIMGFRTPMRQIFQNLVSNALKYRRAGVAPEIFIKVKDQQDRWLFTASDNGIGIEQQYFDKIFIIFQRLHSRDEYSGTGMGLALTKKIIENNGGKIWVASQPEKGSTFYFTILKEPFMYQQERG
jgi:PAS domain S-box-containing protein